MWFEMQAYGYLEQLGKSRRVISQWAPSLVTIYESEETRAFMTKKSGRHPGLGKERLAKESKAIIGRFLWVGRAQRLHMHVGD